MQTSTNLTRWRKWFNDKSEFVTLLIIGLSSSIIGLFVNKRVKRRHDILGKEDDTLLKNE